MINARIFVHPRCWDGPASGALIATLEAAGWDLTNINIGPLATHRRRELVRQVSQPVGAYTMYERMDGTRFRHRMGQPAPAWEPNGPEAA